MILLKNIRKIINICIPYNLQNKAGSIRIYGNPKRQISLGAVILQHSEEEKFHDVFPDIVSSIVQRNDKFPNVYGIGSFIKELVEYNSAGGKKPRGLMTVQAYKVMADDITEESMKRARLLGWHVEMTSLILLDDIIDNSSTRRGSVCWYKLPHVGIRAINDSVIFLSILYDSMRANFGNEPWYPKLLDYFNKGMLLLMLGQHMDYTSLRNYKHFTMDNYNTIASTKMAHYTFKIPIYCALMLANKPHEDVFKNIEDIITDMGILIMMQNDYMDCFGDESDSGKAGTDIQEGKCTWFAVTALQLCNAEQRAQFAASYGSADAASVQRVRRLYETLHLPALYRDAERAAYRHIVTRIQALPPDNVIPSTVLLKVLDMMYYLRSKPERILVFENV